MNIFRELRKFNNKSLLPKIRILLFFSILLIVSTYAWFRTTKNIESRGLVGTVESWDVSYVDLNGELEEEFTVKVPNFSPGTTFEKDIMIRNIGSASSYTTYQVLSVKYFGEEVKDTCGIESTQNDDGSGKIEFFKAKDEHDSRKYPFDISCSYDKSYLEGKFLDNETSPESYATIKLKAFWEYTDKTIDDTEFSEKDKLDTRVGKDVYGYYNNATSEEEIEDVLVIKIKVITERYKGTYAEAENSTSNTVSTNVIDREDTVEKTEDNYPLTSEYVKLSTIYGKNGAGVAYFKMQDAYEGKGYDITSQVVHKNEKYSEENFEEDPQVEGLSVGDNVYLKIFDSNNEEVSRMKYTVNELENFSDTYVSHSDWYTDPDGVKVLIPAGFKVGTSSINNRVSSGLVIENGVTGDQFVWVPVESINYSDVGLKILPTKYQEGYSATTLNRFFETCEQLGDGDYIGLGNVWREPSLVTGSENNYTWKYIEGTEYDADSKYYKDILGFDSPADFGEYLNKDFSQMVRSVEKYGGFYVGRYETSYVPDLNTGSLTAKSIINNKPMVSANWYEMYYRQNSTINKNNYYHSSKDINCGMISYAQWIATGRLMFENDSKNLAYLTSVFGNRSGELSKTGKYANDVVCNIMDMSGNVGETSVLASSTDSRACISGDYTTSKYTISSIRGYKIGSVADYIGSRMTLYIKDTEIEESFEISTKSTYLKTPLTIYGSNTNGYTTLELLDKYKDGGYTIKYQVVSENKEIEKDSFITGTKVTSLKNGDKIYVKVIDKNNILAEDVYVFEVSGLEEVSDTLYSQITASNFGDYVDYPVDLNGDGNTKNDWRIFYKNNEEGTNNVFLIAADYVDWSKNTLNTSAMSQDSSYAPYDVYWSDTNLSNATTSLSASKFLYSQMTQLNTNNNNFKAVSNLLNTTYWTNFVNSTYASSAVGSPTVEMFMNSWNAKFSGNTSYSTLNCKYDYSSSGSGYYVGTGTSTPSSYATSVTGYNSTGADLYWPHTSSVTSGSGSCYGYWLASPSARSSSHVLRVIHNSYVSYYSYSNYDYYGVRPVVSLKSDILGAKEGTIWKLTGTTTDSTTSETTTDTSSSTNSGTSSTDSTVATTQNSSTSEVSVSSQSSTSKTEVSLSAEEKEITVDSNTEQVTINAEETSSTNEVASDETKVTSTPDYESTEISSEKSIIQAGVDLLSNSIGSIATTAVETVVFSNPVIAPLSALKIVYDINPMQELISSE